jgi:uncharacterized coiled-coil protein SlyX
MQTGEAFMSVTQLAPRIAVYKFWTKIVSDPKDPNVIREEDWVSYGPIGMGDRSQTADKVSRLAAVAPSRDMQNPAVRAAAMRWDAVKPLYDAWKAGREAPINGTPLAVLNSVPQEQADYLRTKGVKTVEELAELTDTHIERMKLSGLRQYIAEARRWLDASDSRKTVAALAEKDREIANQQAQLTDQQEQMRAMMQRIDDLAGMVVSRGTEAEPKRGPGRPRKDADAEAAA